MKQKSTAGPPVAGPENYAALRAKIAECYPDLSRRLQQVAQFALDNPTDMALETVATISARIGVQPSTLIRFAKNFRFSGFSEMQRIFQSALLEQVPSYSERMRQALRLEGKAAPNDAVQILREFCIANTASLRHLHDAPPSAQLELALDMLSRARVVHVVGLRRSFPVAAYLAYALSHSDRRTHLLSGVAGLLSEQAQLIDSDDLLVAISANPYAPETVEVVEATAKRGVPIIALTDSSVSPLARIANLCFTIHDAELHGFRSLTATLCLAQTLVVGLALSQARKSE